MFFSQLSVQARWLWYSGSNIFRFFANWEVQIWDFGDHSEYVHWMIAHAKEDCLFALTELGNHLSYFSCQTSEHFNKVLKRSVERLHGFLNCSVGKQAWRNKFGFLMHEYMLQMFHFFDTISITRYQVCSSCHKRGHNKRTCRNIPALVEELRDELL